jgi:curved DNA-binding protein CbpA
VALLDKDRRLRLADGVDLRALPLTPEDAFVVSHLDGSASENDIALATGLDVTVIRRSLDKLNGLGALAVSQADSVSRSPRPPVMNSASPSGTFKIHVGAVIEQSASSKAHHPAAALYDPTELDEAVDLDKERKRKVLDTYYRLQALSHYELLGVEASADKKAIKAAYFELVNDFHPDRYFGKNLGSFKPKLERLFARVTEAHDVLTRGAAREEYDRYLASVRRAQALDRTLADHGGAAGEVERLTREIQEQVKLEEKARQSYPPPAQLPSGGPVSQRNGPTPSAPLTPRNIATPTPPPVSGNHSYRPADADARRRALARKLGVSLPPAARGRSSPLPTIDFSAREAASADLKRRYEERIGELKSRQVQRYVSAAEEAEQRKDLVSATNALRIASSLAPEDTALSSRLRDLEARAQAGLADSYIEQAQYEEREGRFIEAAASYRRATRGKPSPRVLERVAHCLYAGKGDLREAADFAKRARDAAPDDANLRVTLGKIYLEAGMKQSAVAEFERAQQLAPKDDNIKDWLRRAKKGDA